MNGAESLVRTLLESGVDVCFTNPGTSEMHFVAALDQAPEMRCVLALFEGVATGAADGYYRMRGVPASTLLHLGPGLANGLANLHNAKKAGVGVVNIVGEHAIPHIALDAPLTADIEGIARPVSHWVRTSTSAAAVGADGAAAVAAAMTPPGQIATLILPGDTAWGDGGVPAAPIAPRARAPYDTVAIDYAAQLLDGPESLLFLGGGALTAENLARAAQIAAKTGCALMAEWSNTRMARGAGRAPVPRLPYPVDQAVEALKPYRRIVLMGARAPVAFFAYPDKPGKLHRADAALFTAATAEEHLDGALDALTIAVGAANSAPRLADRSAPSGAITGPITAETLGPLLARAIPENAVIVDEAITAGRALGPATETAAPHEWLSNRGGSIGYGLPVAIGAAIAAPDRKVLAMIGDGSAMYTVQALWTMAREGLDITVLIFANRTYNILLGELANVGVQNPGPRALDMMRLDNPALGWVDMARGMGVEGTRADDAESLERALAAGFAAEGPYLIEAAM